MSEYQVVWMINVNCNSKEEAAATAQAIMRDPSSIATVFFVTPLHDCGKYHEQDTDVVDLQDPGGLHGH